jgi:hypothetical protein
VPNTGAVAENQAAWWLIDNSHGGIHLGCGRTAVEAKAYVRESIAETYAGEGLPPSACRQAAHSYRVRLVGGPLTYEAACAARAAWNAEDWESALQDARPNVRRAYGLPVFPRKS